MRVRKIILLAFVLLLAVMVFSCGDSKPQMTGSATGIVLAWTPSHQDDTGKDWHEYKICGDIVKRTMALLPDFRNALCWETDMGLTSDNPAALKSERDQVRAADAQVFISIHVNSAASSGLAARYYEGDTASGRYADTLLKSISQAMGLAYTPAYGTSELYILDPDNNPAPIRVLLECGGNKIDRPWLSTEDGRQRLAAALAKAIRENTPPTIGYGQGEARLVYSAA